MRKIILSMLVASLILMTSGVAGATKLTTEQQSDLYSYGIMVGDENGDLRLDDTITRAEAVKMICCASNADVSSVENLAYDRYFKDIPQNHWAIQYIHAAKELGIVDGDENGNFNPEEEITYSEIIKMVVSVLGYDPMAETIGGYPDGYIKTASRFGITKGLNVANDVFAVRADIALMIVTALDIPIMKQSPNTTETEYQIMNGENGIELITLRSVLNRTK